MRLSNKFALILATAVVMAPVAAYADLVGTPAEPPAMDPAQQELLESNPDLGALADTAPWALRMALAKVGSVPRDAGIVPRPLTGLDEYELKILGRNPSLMLVYQSSPDAAVELLALIKAAAGSAGKKDGPAGSL